MAKKKVADQTGSVKAPSRTRLFVCNFPGVYLGGYALVKARSSAEAKRLLLDRIRHMDKFKNAGRDTFNPEHTTVRETEFSHGVDLVWDGDY